VNKKITLDMNGKSISSTVPDIITVESAWDLTIKWNWTIKGPDNWENFDSRVLIWVSWKLTIEDGTLIAKWSWSDWMYGVYVYGNGTAIFGKNDWTWPTITSHFAAIGENHMTAPAHIIVYWWTYTANATPTNNEWWSYFCAPVYAPWAWTINIQWWTFSGYYGISDRYADVDQDLTIEWWTFNASSNIAIFVDEVNGSNGTADRNIEATTNTLTLPDGYAWAWNPTYGYVVKEQFTFKFMRDDAVFYSGTVIFGETVSAPTPNPADKDWYTFSGWSLSGTSSAYDFSTPATESLIFNVIWKANKYTVVFDKNDTAAVWSMDNQEFTYDLTGNLSANLFTKAWYDLSWWALTSGGPVVYTDWQKVNNLTTENGDIVTLYAIWKEHEYTVTFNPGDWVVDPTSKSVIYKSTYGDLPTPQKTGHTFKEWRTPDDYVVIPSSIYKDTQDITLTAVYTINKYNITFVDEDGAELKVATPYDYGTASGYIVAPADPTKDADGTYTYEFAW